MKPVLSFQEAARLPAPGDNVAIAVQRIDSGTRLDLDRGTVEVPFTVLEAHRFAVRPISSGQPLLSWGQPFGTALRDIQPGEYVCNQKMLSALAERHVPFALPPAPNFKDHFVLYQLDPQQIRPGSQVPLYDRPGTFQGFARPSGRGVGTRNFIAIISTTSRTGSYVRRLAEHFRDLPLAFKNIDGIGPIAHTEGAGVARPNNLDFVLRCLAGFIVHPNVAAAFIVDDGGGYVTNAMLQDFMSRNGYPLSGVLHEFFTIRGSLAGALEIGRERVRGWLPAANACQRTPQPLRHLNIGLQCGGSDAFSGVSGNPLAGCVAKELVRHGGSANLAETDELIGAEPYILENVRDVETARSFLNQIARFQERVEWHGLSAESNPSGGNIYRGLYNIAIKSIGAARKKDPELRVDYVIDYGVPMQQPGFYFMDSPGNDLESVAGQVGAGCNLIVFTTGNGSITNFPFVPTIKIMTNSRRFSMLAREMDINAGRYLDGTSMEDLSQEAFDLTVQIASGKPSAGERAGHSQVQLWREWRQTDPSQLASLQKPRKLSGQPLAWRKDPSPAPAAPWTFEGIRTDRGLVTDQIGLIVPTSLCSGQVGVSIAEKLSQIASQRDSQAPGLRRFAALAHTEGCGVSGDDAQELLQRTLLGYVEHPIVARALLLEHGCEKTHNDAMRNFFEAAKVNPEHFGWASIQLDGGIEGVTEKVIDWFLANGAGSGSRVEQAGLDQLRIGLTGAGMVPAAASAALRRLALIVLHAGGTVVLPNNAPFLASPEFRGLFEAAEPQPSLQYGQPAAQNGLHLMDAPTEHYIETLTGLGATGVEVIVSYSPCQALQAHPIVPVLQFSASSHADLDGGALADLDLILNLADGSPQKFEEQLLRKIMEICSRRYLPKSNRLGNVDFQMTRGWLGVST